MLSRVAVASQLTARRSRKQVARASYTLATASKLQTVDFLATDLSVHFPQISLKPSKIFAAGMLAGGGGSVVGMGGAFIAIPALTSRWIALSQHQAQANSLAAVLATGVGGAASFALAGAVDWSAVVAIAMGGTITANIGARLSSHLPGYTMKGMLGAFMVCTAGAVMLKPLLLEAKEGQAAPDSSVSEDAFPGQFAKLGMIGCGVGLFAGVFGVGGGAITVPALVLCLPELSHHEAIGTSLAAMVLPAVSGLCRHAATGALVPSAAVPLALGTVCGAFFSGRCIALQMDDDTLRYAFTLLMAVLGARTMQSAAVLRRAAVKVL